MTDELPDPSTWAAGDWIIHRDSDYVLRLDRRVGSGGVGSRYGWATDPGGSVVVDDDVPTYWRKLTSENVVAALFGAVIDDELRATINDLERAVGALYLELPAEIVDDVKAKAIAVIDALLAAAGTPQQPANDELLALRTALVKWDFGGDGNRSRTESTEFHDRDRIVDYLAEHYDPDRPYVAVDHIIGICHERWEAVDPILYDVIPEDHWGLAAAAGTPTGGER